MVITIDGPVGVGKSTVAKKLAHQIGFRYIDSGAIYRAVALKALRDQIDLNDETELSFMFHEMDLVQKLDEGKLIFFMDGEDITEEIKKPEITNIVSTIAFHPAIRFHVTALLHVWGADGNIVMEGRDTGTYIFPDADYKFYLDADLINRAERRLKKYEKPGL